MPSVMQLQAFMSRMMALVTFRSTWNSQLLRGFLLLLKDVKAGMVLLFHMLLTPGPLRK